DALEVGEVGAGERGDHIGRPECGRHVDAGDPGVRVWAAQDRQVQHAGHGHVLGPAGAAADEVRVLLAEPGAADLAFGDGGGHVPLTPTGWADSSGAEAGSARICAAASRTARTMFW